MPSVCVSTRIAFREGPCNGRRHTIRIGTRPSSPLRAPACGGLPGGFASMIESGLECPAGWTLPEPPNAYWSLRRIQWWCERTSFFVLRSVKRIWGDQRIESNTCACTYFFLVTIQKKPTQQQHVVPNSRRRMVPLEPTPSIRTRVHHCRRKNHM